MTIRTATTADIKQLQVVRNAVNENKLSHPSLIADEDYITFIVQNGKGWVCETESNQMIVGFAIVDLKTNNVWALFLLPAFEGQGIGKRLHYTMLDWYFSQTQKTIWLSTEPKTRAEQFYRNAGWLETGIYGKGEIKFEMSYERWKTQNRLDT